MHALIIEDEPLVAMGIEDILRECGFYSFDLACTSQDAFEAVARRCPDLITSDVQLMPGSGIDTVATICGGSPVPVIFITGNVADVIVRMPDATALAKPFSEAALREAVALVLAKPHDAAILIIPPEPL